MLEPIVLSTTLAELHPARSVFAPWTTWEQAKWAVLEPYRLELATGFTLTVTGDMPLICHQAAAPASVLDFLKNAGLPVPEDMVTFETAEEAVALAIKRTGSGERLVYIYPPPEEICAKAPLLVSTETYRFLNNKLNLVELAGGDRVPKRQSLRFADARNWKGAVPAFLKVAVAGANGGGYDARYCADWEAWNAALDGFSDRSGVEPEEIIVEEAVEVGTCWCMGVAIFDESVRYLGGAAQIFSSPAIQTGNRIDPSDPPPEEAISAALEIAERGRKLGYRGIAGFDMAAGKDGRLYVFDLNFRLNASTTALLLHDEAVKRVSATVSESWAGMVEQPINAVLDALLPFAESGEFVPTRFYDATPRSRGISTIGGLIVAGTVAEIQNLRGRLDEAIR